ncbi:hypothetical protein [Streptomyces viridosporus]|uniref:Peptidase inhibitor family I36 n=2 Tax=Streptomyces viridosporus TaxID=67581 RepID=A0ABX6A7J7_STRVD|nr:hypothetical protein [Streptomyces viridosporus]EFE71815.1 predicted protein [Streptomyces viridosporus ATCC 14672]QEU83725.1 hypothetical protein CP969_02645 [Streptomyces viridosporus T7A]
MKTSRRTVKRVGWAAAVATGLLATSVGTAVATPTVPTAAASPAQATASCAYPYVCLFKNGVKIGQFQDVTSGYQNLPSRPVGTSSSPIVVTNTRHDDVAYIRFSTGTTVCLPPEYTTSLTGTLTGIRISSSATC